MQGLKALLIALIVTSFFLPPFAVFADDADGSSYSIAQTNDPMAPASDVTQEEMNSTSAGSVDVASLFWPIVPGTTVADGTFFLKQIKEALTGMIKFGNIDKAKYYTELSEKRIVEANKLIQEKNYPSALKSLKMSEEMRKTALSSKKKAVESKEEALDLINQMVASFEKQKQVLEYFSVAMPADQKATVDEFIKNIGLQTSEAK